jgi:uncharacterized protein (UPF0276 family)
LTSVDHVDETALGRLLLLENPATYVRFEEATIPETEFLQEVARATGCGLLLDVSNVFVSARNHGTDASTYLEALPLFHQNSTRIGNSDAPTQKFEFPPRMHSTPSGKAYI